MENPPPNPHPEHPGVNVPPGYNVPQSNVPPGHAAPEQAPAASSPSQPVPQQAYRKPRGVGAYTRQIFNRKAYMEKGTAAWGAASLIISLFTFLLGGLLWPLSFIFGLIGLVGDRRGKIGAFVGTLISGIGLMFWGVLIYQYMQLSISADEAGAPVVEAIAQFKQDHERVPHDLEELVTEGYLPHSWKQGLDELDDGVRESIENRPWADFLNYRPGAKGSWDGEDGIYEQVEDRFLDHAEKAYQNYGLAYIGNDGVWGTYDDEAVKQNPEVSFDLTQLRGGDPRIRKIALQRRELQMLMKQLSAREAQLQLEIPRSTMKLVEHEQALRRRMDARGLATLQDVRQDEVASGWLKLIGETQKVVLVASEKLRRVQETRQKVDIKIKRLANQETLAHLSDSRQELVELESLLASSKDLLDGKGTLGYLDDLTDDAAAEDWFRSRYK